MNLLQLMRESDGMGDYHPEFRSRLESAHWVVIEVLEKALDVTGYGLIQDKFEEAPTQETLMSVADMILRVAQAEDRGEF